MAIAIALQGTTPTTITAGTDTLQFAGSGGFNSSIPATEYNDSTHVKDGSNANKSSSNTPNNVKFISQSGGTGGDSQADWGDGTEDLDAITNAEATLKFTFTDSSSVETSDALVYAYDGTTPATPPVGIDVRLAEVGDTNWTEAEGSGAALALNDHSTPATSHDFYICASVSPQTAGLKTGKIWFELSFF